MGETGEDSIQGRWKVEGGQEWIEGKMQLDAMYERRIKEKKAVLVTIFRF